MLTATPAITTESQNEIYDLSSPQLTSNGNSKLSEKGTNSRVQTVIKCSESIEKSVEPIL